MSKNLKFFFLGLILGLIIPFLVTSRTIRIEVTGDAWKPAVRQDAVLNSIETFIPAPTDGWQIKKIVTAYSADKWQTDDTPIITASNQKVREGIVANNCLPFGSKVVIGNKIYEVQDRMNPRYGCERFDIFLWDYTSAKEFGVQELPILVIK